MLKTKESNLSKSGISLIVLVITIIVIIILAAAVILTLTGNNPIENAKQATFINDLSTFQDDFNMYKTNEYAKSQGNFDQSTLNADSTNLALLYTYIPSLEGKTKYENDISVVAGVFTYKGAEPKKKAWAESINIATPKLLPTVTFGTNGGSNPTQVSTTVIVADTSGSGLNLSSLQYIWDTQNVTEPATGWAPLTNGGTLTKSGTGIYYLWVKASDNSANNVVTKSSAFGIGNVEIPLGIAQTEHKTFAGATTGFAYNNPVIPSGFVAVNTTNASWNNLNTDWNNGLVIQDSSGNQFVWVPVDASVLYEKWCTTGYGYTGDDILPSGVSNEIGQITTYKGFYIARYESGNLSNNLVIKKGATVWNNINYTDAKNKSESMYNTTSVKSGLVTGTMWDTTLKWIQNSSISVTNCRTWGNYINALAPANVSGYGALQTTGYSDFWRAKNIYDLAGNTYEWTNEKNAANFVFRGGTYYHNGESISAAFRDYSPNTYAYSGLSFRVALYIL